MALRPLSAEKRAILDSPQSGVVSAGAGSGKTTLLARAVFEDVVSRDIPIERILVVAFNNAAAAHLVARIQDEFVAGRDASEPAIDLSCAWVGTFHALCGRIVRERAHAAGVAPDLVVLDELESRMLLELALDEAAETCEHPGVIPMLAAFTDARAAARSVLDRGRAAGETVPVVPVPPRPAFDPAPLRRAARAVLDHVPPMTEGRCRKATAALAAAEAETYHGLQTITGKVAAQFAACCDTYNAAAGEALRVLSDRALHPHLDAFAAYVGCLAEVYERLKQERGAVDFEDLQLLARDVLRHDPAARAAYRFQRLYVDEAQDVNPLQDDLIELLAADAERVLRVGDEQQSIYRFRWADVDCFRQARTQAKAFPLRENYRSQAAVLGPLNAWFGEILGSFEPLRVAVEPAATPDPAVELVVVEDPATKTTRAHDAPETAAVVRRLHDRDEFRWGEIVVLFRARTEIQAYDAALRAVGAPTVMIGGNVFAEQEQVADVLGLLALVENPHDEEALVRVLASPYVAASDDDLLALREAAGPGGALWDAVERVPDGLDLLSGFAYKELCEEDKALGEEEERRITYVAMTRAKRHLSVVGRAVWRANGGRGWEGQMAWIAESLPAAALPGAGETRVVRVGDSAVSVRSAVPEAAVAGVLVGPPALVEGGVAPAVPSAVPAVDPLRGLRVSYSALELHAACSLRYHLQVELGLAATDTIIAGNGGGLLGARAFGERFHEAIEQVDWRAPVLPWDDDRAQKLFAVIRDGELGSRLAAAVEVRTEWPFLVGVGGAVVEGVADVWAREADGTVLIADWKTGTLHGPDDPGYALQQAIYALAGLRAGAGVVETAWCHVAHEGADVARRYGAGDVEGLERQVRGVLGGLAAAPVPAVEKPAPVCTRCPGLRMGCPIGPVAQTRYTSVSTDAGADQH